MTEKQKRFADEYLVDCNATRAYKAAYPRIKNDNAAHACAAKLLRNATISQYISERLEEISSEKTADAQEVLEYLTRVLRGEYEPERKPPDEKDRLKAAELLGKRYGLFKEAVAVGFEPVVIENDLKE